MILRQRDDDTLILIQWRFSITPVNLVNTNIIWKQMNFDPACHLHRSTLTYLIKRLSAVGKGTREPLPICFEIQRGILNIPQRDQPLINLAHTQNRGQLRTEGKGKGEFMVVTSPLPSLNDKL